MMNMLQLIHPRRRAILRHPRPAGQVIPDDQGVRVLAAQDPLADGQLGGIQVPGPGHIPRHAGPTGEAATAVGEGSRVLGAQDPLPEMWRSRARLWSSATTRPFPLTAREVAILPVPAPSTSVRVDECL